MSRDLFANLFLWYVQVNLRLLLIDGKTQDFLFVPSTSATNIAQHVFANWPEEWVGGETQRPDRAEVLRFIYRGRFLHTSTTLQSKNGFSPPTPIPHTHTHCLFY